MTTDSVTSTMTMAPTTGRCPLCGETARRSLINVRRDKYSEVLPGLGPVRFAACVGCGLVRQDPRPSEADLRRLYASQLRPFLGAATPSDHYLEFAKGVAGSDFSLLRTFAPDVVRAPGRMLEIGCATGQFMRRLVTEGWEAVGIEPDAMYAAFGRETYGLTLEPAFFEDFVAAPASFDLIACLHVLEHVGDPRATLEKIHRLLRPGGHVFLSVPNLRQYDARHRHPDLFERVHLYAFSRDTLAALLARCGFAVVGVDVSGKHLSVVARSVAVATDREAAGPRGDRPAVIVSELRRYRARRAVADVARRIVIAIAGRRLARRLRDALTGASLTRGRDIREGR